MIIDALSAPGTPALNMSVGPAQGTSAPAPGVSFEEALGNVVGSAIDTLKTGGGGRDPGRARRRDADERSSSR